VFDLAANCNDVADAFVAGDERRIRLCRPVSFRSMKVGVAHATGINLDEDLVGPDLGDGKPLNGERLSELADDGS